MAKTKPKMHPSPYPHIEVRLEFRGGASKKFYALSWDAAREVYEINYGRIGTAGQTLTYEPGKALAKYEEKRKEGYEIVSGPSKAATPLFELSARGQARLGLLQGVTAETLLSRHGHKNVKFHDIAFLGDGADLLGVPPMPRLASWLTRLGVDGVYNVREVFNEIGQNEDQEPTDEEKAAAFRLLLAVSDLV